VRLVIEERGPRLGVDSWVEEDSYPSIQLARQAYLVYRSQLQEGEALRMRLEDNDGNTPDGWTRGAVILYEHTIKDGVGVRGSRVSDLLTEHPEMEKLINEKLRK
jgi:hypothetical protein